MIFRCSNCNEESFSKRNCERHINNLCKGAELITVDGSISCEFCNLSYKTLQSLHRHYKDCKEKKAKDQEILKELKMKEKSKIEEKIEEKINENLETLEELQEICEHQTDIIIKLEESTKEQTKISKEFDKLFSEKIKEQEKMFNEKIKEQEKMFKEQLKLFKEHSKEQDKNIKTQESKLISQSKRLSVLEDIILPNRDQRIRADARRVYKSYFGSNKCIHCKTDVSDLIQVCHIKPVRDFSWLTPNEVINRIDNLIGLCANCHLQLDRVKNLALLQTASAHSFIMRHLEKVSPNRLKPIN